MRSWPVFVKDMNADGRFTVDDAGLWLYHGFFLPGDYVLSVLLTRAPAFGQFLELSPAHYGSVLSGVLSCVIWLGTILLTAATWNLVRQLDRRLTAYAGRLWAEARRRARVARALMAYRLGRLTSRARPPDVETPREIALDELDVAVLRSQADLAPGYVVAASDIASALDIGVPQAEQTLDKLRKLHLVDSAFGTVDGESGYRLSGPGEAFLTVNARLAADR